MEDQTTWKGHSFTLLVFTGIVVLSSIFFVLGMLVGRAQGQKLAGAVVETVPKGDAKASPKEDEQKFTFYDSVKKEEPATLQPAPSEKPAAPPEPIPVDPPKKVEVAPDPPVSSAVTSGSVLNYQVGALRKEADAEKLLNEVKKKGVHGAFILKPAPDEANPFYRVQVGPFKNQAEAQAIKKRLELAGYQPIPKK
jgi:cell division protein FtsN